MQTIKLYNKSLYFDIHKAKKNAYSDYVQPIFNDDGTASDTDNYNDSNNPILKTEAEIPKEGDTKQGKGGLLKLTRNPSGKGLHWRLVDKEQSPSNKSQPDKSKVTDVTRSIIKRLNDSPTSASSIFDKEGNLIYTGMLVAAKEGLMSNEIELIFRHEDGIFTLPISKKKFHATLEDKIITIENRQGDKIVVDTSNAEGIAGTGYTGQYAAAEDEIPFENVKEMISNEYIKKQYDYVAEAKGLSYMANKSQQKVRDEFSQIAEKFDVYSAFNRKSIDEIADELETNERYGQAHKNDDIVIYESNMMINNYEEHKEIIKEFEEKGYKIKNIIDGIKDNKSPGYVDIAVTMMKGDDKTTLMELRFMTPQIYLKWADFGVDLNKVVNRIEKFSLKHSNSMIIKKVVPEIKEQAVRILNKYYEQAYYSDFRPNSSDKPKFKQSNMSAWDDDSPTLFDREIKSLRGILKRIMQPLLAASVSFSGLNPSYSSDNSLMIDDTVKDIVKPIKKIEKLYTSKIINLMKSLKSNIIRNFNF